MLPWEWMHWGYIVKYKGAGKRHESGYTCIPIERYQDAIWLYLNLAVEGPSSSVGLRRRFQVWAEARIHHSSVNSICMQVDALLVGIEGVISKCRHIGTICCAKLTWGVAGLNTIVLGTGSCLCRFPYTISLSFHDIAPEATSHCRRARYSAYLGHQDIVLIIAHTSCMGPWPNTWGRSLGLPDT